MDNDYQLIKVSLDTEWEAYHSIRRQVLWGAEEQLNYDAEHPDEYLSNNYPLLLLLNNIPIGTTRLDDFQNGLGAVRLVAISDAYQRKGHGRKLSFLTEEYAAKLGIHTLYINAAPNALEYYKKLGWGFFTWEEAELTGIAEDCLQMRKFLNK